jgi:uncharacterized repeat protein (TIGR03837 family)
MTVPRTWDIFCRVVDNYGDVGVCWRLARALVAGQGAVVRLWLDDVGSLAMLAPSTDVDAPVQTMSGIEVRRWTSAFENVVPAGICVEAFGCGLPDAYVDAMAARQPMTLWIVLEYLSAEPCVREHHGLPSPHPRSPVPRFFFFPGFEPGTGGLLREPDLFARRDAHGAEARRRYWALAGFEPPPETMEVVSVFAYPGAPLVPLLRHWTEQAASKVVAVPIGPLAAAAGTFFGLDGVRGGTCARRGTMELRVVPFIPQERYDEALWSADVLLVRGEDSIVRAQWAGRPFVWHIYEQEEHAHRVKLDAFLDRYCADLPAEAAAAVRAFSYAWNQLEAVPAPVGAAWDRYRAHREILEAHTRRWAQTLCQLGDLAENLAEFCRGKLKY